MAQSKDVDGDDTERYGIRFLVDSTNFGLVNTRTSWQNGTRTWPKENQIVRKT